MHYKLFSGRVSRDFVTSFYTSCDCLCIRDRIFINVCAVVRRVYIIIANRLKCVFLLSQVACGPEESLIKYSKFKSKSAQRLHINKAVLD